MHIILIFNGRVKLKKMSCDICYGYPSHNCPCCQDDPQELIVEAIEADENNFDILFEDKIVAVCEPHELTKFIADKSLTVSSDDGDEIIVSGAGFEFWAIRQHADSINDYDRSVTCDDPISMYLFAGKMPV